MLFAEKIKTGKHQAVVQTAACSSLGKMLIRYCLSQKIPLINIIRKQEQESILKSIGAEYVLNSTSNTFENDLKELSDKLNATVAFECVSGKLTGTLVNCMKNDSVIYVYGAMSMSPIEGINPSSLIFTGKKIEGLWLTNWIKSKNLLGL